MDTKNRRLGPWDSLSDFTDAVSDLEDTNVKCTWFNSIASGTSGTITPPTGGTILLDEWSAGVDVLVSGISSAVPTFESVIDTEGAIITGTLDASGNWTISGTPGDGYPIGLIYVYRVALSAYDYTSCLESAQIEGVNTLALLGNLANELTGFPDDYRDKSTLAFVDGTRVFSITPAGSVFSIWVLGKEFIYTSAETVEITDVEGIHWIYFDSAGAIQEAVNPTHSQQENLIMRNALVSYILWDATNSTATIFADERHGLTMDGATHNYLHEITGFAYHDGLTAGDITADGSGADNVSATLSLTDGTLYDEDMGYDTSDSGQTLTTPAQIPVYYIDGVAGIWRKDAADDYPVKNFAGGSSLLAYNSYSAPNYSQTEIGNNNFVLCHIFAVNDISEPIIAVQGQTEYNSIKDAREGAETEMLTLNTLGLPAEEYAPLYSIIYQTSTTYSNVPLARIRTTDLGDDYVDWRVTVVGSGGGGGSGDVTGPSSSTDNAITRWDGATGSVVQDSSTLMDDTGNVLFPDGTGLQDAAGNSAIKINSTGSIEFYFNNIKEGETFSGGLKATNSLTIAATTNVTGILDEDNMASNSAVSLATQQSIKAYVDAQVTLQDLDFIGDAGGAQSVDLDSQTLTLEGGTGIGTTGSAQKMSFAIDSTVTTLTGTQILTNKTLTSPIINTILAKTAETGISIVADGAVSLYHNAAVTAQTYVNGNGEGIALGSSAGFVIVDDSVGDFSYIRSLDRSNGLYIDSFRSDANPGTITIRTDNAAGAITNNILCNGGGSVDLYHNGVVKLVTSAAGATLTGTLIADGLTLGDAEVVNFGAATDMSMTFDGSIGRVTMSDADFRIRNYSGGFTEMATFTYNGAVDLYYNGVQTFETNAAGITTINATATGTADCLKITNNAATAVTNYNRVSHALQTTTQLRNAFTVTTRWKDNTDATRDSQTFFQGYNAGVAINWINMADAAVQLYYDGVSRLQTTATGVNIKDGTDTALLFYSSGSLVIRNTNHGGNIQIQGEDAATGAIKSMILADPDSFVKLYYNGSLRLEIENSNINATANMNPAADDLYDVGSVARRWDDIYATNGTIQTSGRNNKRSITDSIIGLDFINKLRPVSFIFKDVIDDHSIDNDKSPVRRNVHARRHHGLVAQDVKSVMDELGIDSVDFAGYIDTVTNGLGLRYSEFIAPMIKAIQELTARVAVLEGASRVQ